MTHVFTYGSLMFPEVWQRVVRGKYQAQAAFLAGYSRHALAERDYPGMVACPVSSEAQGVLWRDVNDQDLARLDAFEGAEYRRIEVSVRLADGNTLQAGTYLYIAGDLQQEQWNAQAFVAQRFLQAHPPAAELD